MTSAGKHSAPWLSLVGLGADGLGSLAPSARDAIARATLVVGAPRQLALVNEFVRAETMSWPSPLAEGIPRLLARFDVDRLGHLEWADDERRQIRRHQHRVGKADGNLVAARGRHHVALDLRPVRDREQIGFHNERDAEHGLEIGLVPAWEGAPAIGGLHLRRRDDSLVAVGISKRAAVEAPQLVVQHTGEHDLDDVLARREFGRRSDEKPLGLVVESVLGGLAIDEAALDLELGRV